MTVEGIQNGDKATAAEVPPEMEFRMEHDLIGDERVPKHAYYGIQTQRA